MRLLKKERWFVGFVSLSLEGVGVVGLVVVGVVAVAVDINFLFVAC